MEAIHEQQDNASKPISVRPTMMRLLLLNIHTMYRSRNYSWSEVSLPAHGSTSS